MRKDRSIELERGYCGRRQPPKDIGRGRTVGWVGGCRVVEKGGVVDCSIGPWRGDGGLGVRDGKTSVELRPKGPKS